MNPPVVGELPADAPHTDHPWVRCWARAMLRLFGWKLIGDFPDLPKMLILVVPHSSAWDVIWGMLIKLALGMRIDFMATSELFFFPLGRFLRLLGAVPVDRHAAHGVVGATVRLLKSKPVCWVALAPEGTRRACPKWRSGFWHIARLAKVPLCCVYIHYPEKVFGIGPVLEVTKDMAADIEQLRAIFAPYQGRNRRRN